MAESKAHTDGSVVGHGSDQPVDDIAAHPPAGPVTEATTTQPGTEPGTDPAPLPAPSSAPTPAGISVQGHHVDTQPQPEPVSNLHPPAADSAAAETSASAPPAHIQPYFPTTAPEISAESHAPSVYTTNESANTSFITPNDSDGSDIDGYYSDTDASSFMSSVLSGVRRGVEENGRLYPSYGRYMYGMPADEREMDRNDLNHHKFSLMLNGRLHHAPIPQHAQRILDLGTGTGIWAIDMAFKHPNAEVIGVDIAACQPDWVPNNCHFEIDDVEEPWLYNRKFDFIYGREFLTAIRDWPKLIDQSFANLNPGGWLELSNTIPDISSDDNTIPENSQYLEAGRLFFEMAEKMGAPLDAPRLWKQQLTDAGFVDVAEVVYKIPMGPWAKDRQLRTIGAVERMMLLEGFEAFMLRGYTQILKGNPDVLQVILAQARKEISDPKIHTYVYWHVCYGRKP